MVGQAQRQRCLDHRLDDARLPRTLQDPAISRAIDSGERWSRRGRWRSPPSRFLPTRSRRQPLASSRQTGRTPHSPSAERHCRGAADKGRGRRCARSAHRHREKPACFRVPTRKSCSFEQRRYKGQSMHGGLAAIEDGKIHPPVHDEFGQGAAVAGFLDQIEQACRGASARAVLSNGSASCVAAAAVPGASPTDTAPDSPWPAAFISACACSHCRRISCACR